MKLALYLPNFRDKVTVKELEDLTGLAEELDFDSVRTLDRIVVPEASDRQELQYPFGMMMEFPPALPVSSRGEFLQGMPLIPWLAAKTSRLRIGMSITDTPFRAPGGGGGVRHIDHLSGGRLNVGVGSGWMPEEFAAASVAHIFPRRHKHVRETIEVIQGDLGERAVRVPRGVRRLRAAAGSGPSRCSSRTRRSTSAGSRIRSASATRIAKYGLSGWIGIQDSPEESRAVAAEIARELEEFGSPRSMMTREFAA